MKRIFNAPHVLSSAAVILAAVASLLVVSPAQGDVFTWDGEKVSNNWDANDFPSLTVTNWEEEAGFPAVFPGAGDDVVFPDTAMDFIVNLNGNRTVVSATFSGVSNYTLNNNTLTLSSGNITSTGSATHTINSNVVLGANGTWDVASPTTLQIDGNISGNFAIIKQGAGTLTLTGANTIAGLTNILNGTLQIGNGGTTGSITGNVAIFPGSVLAFNRSNEWEDENCLCLYRDFRSQPP